MEKERTIIFKRKENTPYDFNINEEYKKYFILPDDKNIKSDNLYFQEVVAEIGKAFAENKMILVDDI